MEFIESEAVDEDMLEGGVAGSEEEEEFIESEEDSDFIDNSVCDSSPPPPNPYMDFKPRMCGRLEGAIRRIEGRVKVYSIYVIIISD